MNVSDEERRDAEMSGVLVSKKLKEIMELQAGIDALMRGQHPTPFGASKWEFASIEALLRLVAMAAIQFVLFEPEDRVQGQSEFKVTAEKLMQIIAAQLKTLKTKKSDW